MSEYRRLQKKEEAKQLIEESDQFFLVGIIKEKEQTAAIVYIDGQLNEVCHVIGAAETHLSAVKLATAEQMNQTNTKKNQEDNPW